LIYIQQLKKSGDSYGEGIFFNPGIVIGYHRDRVLRRIVKARLAAWGTKVKARRHRSLLTGEGAQGGGRYPRPGNYPGLV